MFKDIKSLYTFTIITLCVVCSFLVNKYATQLVFSSVYKDSSIYGLFSYASGIFASLVPLIIFLFLYSTTEITINLIFDGGIKKKDLLFIISISFMPFLIYQYFFWYNLITFCTYENIKTEMDLYNIKYSFGLSLSDLSFLGDMCWVLLYTISFILLYLKVKSLYKTFISVFFPSFLVFLIYNLFKVL